MWKSMLNNLKDTKTTLMVKKQCYNQFKTMQNNIVWLKMEMFGVK